MAQAGRTNRSRLLLLVILAGCCVLLYATGSLDKLLRINLPDQNPPVRPTRPVLALGDSARTNEAVRIDFTAPVELDGMTKAEVFTLRRQAVLRHQELLINDYHPSAAAFGQIVDGKPWWGTIGEFYYSKGERSIDGPSEESRFILNPYMLAFPEMWGFSIWTSDFSWKTDKMPSLDDFPFFCRPETIVIHPAAREGSSVYHITRWMEAIRPYTDNPINVSQIDFDLMMINTRDLGFGWAYIDLAESTNLQQLNHADRPFGLREFIHLGGSCGYPGGCNNGSPFVAELSNLSIAALPAEIAIRLWQQPPQNAASLPDFTFRIHFE